jgi:choline dehydrogenase-like flavoprotein
MTTQHYDVIIIGSGAGGDTLAHKLAPSGKRMLLLERGGYLPREAGLRRDRAPWRALASVADLLSGPRAVLRGGGAYAYAVCFTHRP